MYIWSTQLIGIQQNLQSDPSPALVSNTPWMLNINDSWGDSDDDDDWEESTDLDSSSTDSSATEYLPLQRVDPTDSHKRKYFLIIRNSIAQKR